ncbi:MAG TPA: hypothetical protein VG895_02655 [Patescibacteria group bacterium]|nr:hypothetical protein [Patescibacteria group bacterium]
MAKRSTEQNCFINSEFAAMFLVDRYSNLFKTLFLIEARADNNDSFKKGNWRSHSGLVFEDVLGKWHFISPANFDDKKKNNPMFTHIRGDDLNELLTNITDSETKEGLQIWPSETEIMTEVNSRKNKEFANASKV